MQYTQGNSVALTTAWTEVNPNYIIEYSAIYVNSGSITAEIYNNTGWFKTETASVGETLKYIESAKKIRVKATTGVASINYYLSGNPALIASHDEKTVLVDDDLVLIEDSEDSNKTKKVKKSNFDTSGITVHNNLTGKQGGTTDEYYHLTSEQEAGLKKITYDSDYKCLIVEDYT